MTMHSFHPDMHEHGLADGCERCAEHAADPVRGLDDLNLIALVERTQAWMREAEFPRSDTERDAMRIMEHHLIFVRRYQQAVKRDLGGFEPRGAGAP